MAMPGYAVKSSWAPVVEAGHAGGRKSRGGKVAGPYAKAGQGPSSLPPTMHESFDR